MMEIWKDIKGYEGLYQVSNFGKVKDLPKNKLLKFSDNFGFLVCKLSKDGKNSKHYCVHRLVAEGFVPKNGGNNIIHKDGNRYNNYYKNLEWR